MESKTEARATTAVRSRNAKTHIRKYRNGGERGVEEREQNREREKERRKVRMQSNRDGSREAGREREEKTTGEKEITEEEKLYTGGNTERLHSPGLVILVSRVVSWAPSCDSAVSLSAWTLAASTSVSIMRSRLLGGVSKK